MYINGHRGRNRPVPGQNYHNHNQNRGQAKQNQRQPQKQNQSSDDQAVLQGINKLADMFKQEMGGMKDRMSDLEEKNEMVIQQNKSLAENVVRHKEAACAWKLKAEERLQKYKQTLNRVLQLIEHNNDLRRQNDELQREKIDFQERMKILVDRNRIFEEGIRVLISEHKELKAELTKLAESSGVADDFAEGLDEVDEEDETLWKEQERRNDIKAAVVLAYVASKMTK